MRGKNSWNQNGVSLVEVLAVLVIGTILLLMLFNIHLFSQKQYQDQMTKMKHLNDVTYIAKIITKEIRKTTASNVHIMTPDSIRINSIEYRLKDNTESIVKVDGGTTETVLANNIGYFNVEKNSRKIIIEIKSTANRNGKAEHIKTEITLR